jgi:hypothetical protein
VLTRSPIEKVSESGGAPWAASAKVLEAARSTPEDCWIWPMGLSQGGRERGVRHEVEAEKKGGGRERWGALPPFLGAAE